MARREVFDHSLPRREYSGRRLAIPSRSISGIGQVRISGTRPVVTLRSAWAGDLEDANCAVQFPALGHNTLRFVGHERRVRPSESR
jgi:hypothetical protein